MFQVPKTLRSLERDSSWKNIGDSGAKELSEALNLNKTLKKLTDREIEKKDIGDSSANELSEALKLNKRLSAIYFPNNKLGDSGGKEF